MASHKSALKAHRQATERHARNRRYRTRLRHALKSMRAAIAAGKRDEAEAAFHGTVSIIDRMVAKGVIHRNTGARHKSRLSRRLGRGGSAAA